MRRAQLVSIVAVIVTVFGATGAAASPSTAPQKPVDNVIPGTIGSYAVSCPTVTTCISGGATNSTQNGGTGYIQTIVDGTPGAVVPVTGTGQISSLACPTTTFCEAVAFTATDSTGLVAIRDGTPGAFHAAPATDTFLGVSCSTARLCEVVGSAAPSDEPHQLPIVAPVRNGRLGHVSLLKSAVGVQSTFAAVSCVAGFKCTAVGSGNFGPKSNVVKSIAVETINGVPRAVHFKTGLSLAAVSCYRSLASCWSAGYEGTFVGVVAPVKNGAIGPGKEVTGSLFALGISCAAAARCTVAGEYDTDSTGETQAGFTSVVRGGKAGTLTTYTPTWMLNAVSCPVAGPCTSAGVSQDGPGAQSAVVSTLITPRKATLELRASPAAATKASKHVLLTFAVKHLAGQPAPTGQVTFAVGAKTLCSAATLIKSGSNGKAICKTKASQIGHGRHKVVASYTGDAAYQAGQAKATFTFRKA